jgi:hypothetical protein
MGHQDEMRDRTIPEAMRSIVEETRTLARQEIQLAKAELMQKSEGLKEQLQESATLARRELESLKGEVSAAGKKAGIGAGLFGSAGILGIIALGLLGLALVALLAYVMPLWIAAALAALIYVGIAGALALAGRSQLREATTLAPQRVGARLKALVVTPATSIKEQVSLVPERAIETAKETKDRIQQAWGRGSREEAPPAPSSTSSSPNGSRAASATGRADSPLGFPFGKSQ